MIDNRVTRAARRLASDDRVRAAFRADPHGAMRRWRLDDHEVEALRSGDPASLAAAGVDLARVETPPMSLRLQARIALVLAAVTTILVGPTVGTASAGRYGVRVRSRRFGIRYVSGRATILGEATDKVGGRFAVRFSNGVRADVRAILRPDGCKDVKECGIFELVD